MTPEQQQAILTVALFAAFADGNNDAREREHIRELAESLGQSAGADLARVYQDVLFRRVTLAEVCAALPGEAERQFAYEMAVCVCDADGVQTEAEQAFLGRLSEALHLTAPQRAQAGAEAVAIAEAGRDAVPQSVEIPPVGAVPGARPQVDEAELDRSVLNYAILNGALELLPQSWASVAIIPLQVKMVYGIGKRYGYELDQGHIREFLSTVGVGLTSQYLEQFGRKLIGGLLGKAAGKWGKALGGAGTSMAFSFASTYALGQVARRYYAGGRQMSAAVLRSSFQGLLGPAREMQAQYLPAMQAQAGQLNAQRVMEMVRRGV